jgi:hypothetical protein
LFCLGAGQIDLHEEARGRLVVLDPLFAHIADISRGALREPRLPTHGFQSIARTVPRWYPGSRFYPYPLTIA